MARLISISPDLGRLARSNSWPPFLCGVGLPGGGGRFQFSNESSLLVYGPLPRRLPAARSSHKRPTTSGGWRCISRSPAFLNRIEVALPELAHARTLRCSLLEPE